MHPTEKVFHTGSVAAVYPGILYVTGSYNMLLIWSFIFGFTYWLVLLSFLNLNLNGLLIYVSPLVCIAISGFLKIFQSGNMHLLTAPWFLLFLGGLLVLYIIDGKRT